MNSGIGIGIEVRKTLATINAKCQMLIKNLHKKYIKMCRRFIVFSYRQQQIFNLEKSIPKKIFKILKRILYKSLIMF